MATPRLHSEAIFVILGVPRIESGRYDTTTRLVSMEKSWRNAQRDGALMPIVFGDAANDSTALHRCAVVEDLQLNDTGTHFRFRDPVELRGRRASMLLKVSDGKPIGETKLSGYALVKTPSFLSKTLKAQPREIFKSLTAEDVRAAAVAFQQGVAHSFKASKRWDVVIDGRHYPPKAILGLAAQRHGWSLVPDDFSGGDGHANAILERLKFSIVPHSAVGGSAPSLDVDEAASDTDEPIAFPPVERAEIAAVLRVPATNGATRRDDAAQTKGSGRPNTRRRARDSKAVGDRAEEIVYNLLLSEVPREGGRDVHWIAREGATPGWDIEFTNASGQRVAVEVKGTVERQFTGFELTDNEWSSAERLGPSYWVYLVADCRSAVPKIQRVPDPHGRVRAGRMCATPSVWLLTPTDSSDSSSTD